MDFEEKSILDNVVFLDIVTTGLDPNHSEIIEIAAVKVKDSNILTYSTLIKPKGNIPKNIFELCDGLREDELKSSRELKYILKEIVDFIEDMPIICHNGGIKEKFLSHHIPKFQNRILDSMELCGILEPWQKEFNLNYLISQVTSLEKGESHRALEGSMDTMRIVNSFLCRLWRREEKSRSRKNITLYKLLLMDYDLKDEWKWTEFIQRPLFFNDEDYPYVFYGEKKEGKGNIKKIKIPYNEFENLLSRKEIWNNGGDFNYQYRESQKNFSGRIRENIEGNERIFIEAPTGSGKTFAYLLIAILEAYKNKGTHKGEDASFIISTDTKELQNQLIDRDIPNLIRKLNLEDKINYGAMKGKGNYICVEKLIGNKDMENSLIGKLRDIFLKRLCEGGEHGDIENISFWAYNHFNLGDYINQVTCNSEECNLDRCYRPCYLRNRYNELPSENITVVNHSLLASWPYGEKKKISHLIIDEAHNLMEKCYDFFSDEFISKDFQEHLEYLYIKEPTIYRIMTNLNASCGYRESIDLDKIKYWTAQIQGDINLLLDKLREFSLCNDEYNYRTEFLLAEEDIRLKLDKIEPYISKLKENIYGLYSLMNRYFNNITLEGEEGKEEHEYSTLLTYILKLKGSFDTIDSFLHRADGKENHAKEFEVSKDYGYFIMKNIPLNTGELFNEQILKEVKSVTFLSATMRINNSFSRIKGILGQENSKELVVPPTFNLKRRTRIYTVNDIGRYNSSDFVKKSSLFIFNMAKKLNGHLLVLFTNNLRKLAVEEELKRLIKGSRIEVHTNKKAIRYLSDKNRQVIILGSKGFFEGIDVPGDGLTGVILDKIPNKSMDDPLLKAITTYQNRDYRFVNYPQICIKVKQVYGRLIRSVMDYGYFCILDGGTNNATLYNLQKDLGGPIIENLSGERILDRIWKDYSNWNLENLNSLLKNSNMDDLHNSFDDECRKNKSFFEIHESNNEYFFKNMNYRFKK